MYFKNLRADEEARKDSEPREKLKGMSRPLNRTQYTDTLGPGSGTTPYDPSDRVKPSTARLAARTEASTRSLHSDRLEERHRAPPHRTPLTHIASMSFGERISKFQADPPDEILPPSIQRTLDPRCKYRRFQQLSAHGRTTDQARLSRLMKTSTPQLIAERQTCEDLISPHQLCQYHLS